MQDHFHSEDQTQDYQALICFLHQKLGFAKLCEIIPMIKQNDLKNESASLLQKFIDYLFESNLITKEEILEFIHGKQHNSTICLTLSSCFKESYDIQNYEDSSLKNRKKNLKFCKKPSKKQRKRISNGEVGNFSSYSNYSGLLFDEANSLTFEHLKYNNKIEELRKIEELANNNNSSSVKNFTMEKPFRENLHETYG